MKIVNRGFLRVKGKSAFINWAAQQDEEFAPDENSDANIYLVEEDFFEVEPVIEANFKRIFLNELESVSDDSSNFPEIKMENFVEWFDVEAGNAVFDCEKKGLQAD